MRLLRLSRIIRPISPIETIVSQTHRTQLSPRTSRANSTKRRPANDKVIARPAKPKVVYETNRGRMFHSTIESFVDSYRSDRLKGKVQLIFTSPPFPLRRKKRYGNKEGQDYVDWLAKLAKPLSALLTPTHHGPPPQPSLPRAVARSSRWSRQCCGSDVPHARRAST
jgi:hypothetical protein